MYEGHEMIDNRTDDVLAAESERCAAIRAQNFDRLGRLFHPAMIHVHTRGNQDTRESYLNYLAEVLEILDVKRGELKVSFYGDCAVMTGRQYNTARARGTEPIVTIEAQVIQVWVNEQGVWRQVAFQASPVGAPPLPPKVGGGAK
jgi:ketosteroid isomerase-like protein